MQSKGNLLSREIFVTSVSLLSLCAGDWNTSSTLHIAAVYPITGKWNGGWASVVSSHLALNEVNRRQDILPRHQLQIHYKDSGFDVYRGMQILFDFLNTPPTKIMVLGAANSELSESSALLSSMYNLVQVSYASVAPVLSQKKTFPRFFRTSAPDTAVNPARIALLKYFNWTKAATIHHSRAVWDAVTQDLEEKFRTNNITLLTSEVYQTDPGPQVQNLKKNDVRIIFSICNAGEARKVLCEAFKIGITGSKYVWIFNGWYDDNWWLKELSSHRCTKREMENAAETIFSAGDVTLNPSKSKGISGLSSAAYKALYDNATNHENPFGTTLAAQAYDAMWAIALALNTTDDQLVRNGSYKTLDNFTYMDVEVADMIQGNMKKVSFEGVKSPIKFDRNQDPIILVKLEQVQNKARKVVGLYRPEVNGQRSIQWDNSTPVIWRTGKPPRDSTIVILKEVYVSKVLYIAMSVVAALGIVLALVFLTLNVMYRNVRLIKMSSPNINNIILVGCIIAFTTIIFQELNYASVGTFCMLRSYTFIVGFSLAFGALFSKTWRIHVIFANKQLKKKVVKDTQLYLMVAALLLVNIIVLLIWHTVDPIQVQTTNLTAQETSNGDIMTQPQLHRCDSPRKMYFVGTLYVIQGLLLLFGAFLAWETKKVKIPALNDSQFIGMCIYNVVVLSVLGVVMSFVLSDHVELHYGLISTLLLAGTLATQCIIFVPKAIRLKDIKVSHENEDQYVNSTFKAGLNTGASTTHDTSEQSETAKIAALEKNLEAARVSIAQKNDTIERLTKQLNKNDTEANAV